MPIQSVNDFVVRFANVNGSGSASANERRHDQAAIRPARECSDVALDLAGVAHVDRAQLHPE
jgi:hypothetical protein